MLELANRLKRTARASGLWGFIALLGAGTVCAKTPPTPFSILAMAPASDVSYSTATRAAPTWSEDEPLFVDQKIEVERKQVLELPVQGVENFLVVDPAVAFVSPGQDPRSLLVQGLSFGVTHLHVWTETGRRTFEIKVVSARIGKSAQTQTRMNRLDLKQSLSTSYQSYRDYKSPNDRATRGYNYHMNMNGRTALGYNRSSLSYENIISPNGSTRQRISSMRTQWNNGYGEIKAGDVNDSATQLTLPSIGYQGASWSSSRSKRVTVDAMGGYLDRQFWGMDTNLGERPSEKSFTALKTTVKPSENIELFAAGSQALYSAKPEGRFTRGLGAKAALGNWTLESESSLSELGKAWYGDLHYRKNKGYLVLSQRNVDANYTAINGASRSRGESGQSGQIGLSNYGRIAQMDATYNQFRASYLPSKTQPNALNREWRGLLRIKQENTELSQELATRDMPGIYGPSQSEFYRVKLSPFLDRSFRPHFSFRRESGKYYETPLQNYLENAMGAGFTFGKGSGWSFALSAESVRSRNLTTGEEKTYANYSSGLRFSNTWKSLRNSLSVDYRNSTFRFSERTRMIYSSLRTDFSVGKGLNIFCAGVVENRLEAFNTGHTISVNTGLEWGNDFYLGARARKVKGFVFKDLNNDGIRQKGEPALPGVRVTLNGSKTKVTNADGYFAFPSSRGELRVELDPATLPAGMRLSSSNPQIFSESESGEAVSVSFGIAYLGELKGKVCIDINGNGRCDPEDRPIGRVVLGLENGQQAVTDPNGGFSISGVSPGSHQVLLNILTLPANMIMTTPSALDLEMGEGASREIIFLARPVRSLGGIVFWDKNKNGFLDPEEPPVPGAVVTAGDLESAADEQGRYYFTGLPAGKLELSLSPESLQGRWGLKNKSSLFETLFIPEDQPWVQRDKNIALIKIPPKSR